MLRDLEMTAFVLIVTVRMHSIMLLLLLVIESKASEILFLLLAVDFVKQNYTS